MQVSNSNTQIRLFASEVRFKSIYQAAKFYVSLGFNVIPIRRLGNTPITEHGLLDASSHVAFIEKYFSRSTIQVTPQVNIATVSRPGSNLFTVDVDLHGDTNGMESWRTLTKSNAVPRTTAELTQRKGLHLDFLAPFAVRTKTGILPGIDIIGQAHYCIRAPSVREHGKYRLFYSPIAEAPHWLVDLIEKDKETKREHPAIFNYKPTGEIDTQRAIAKMLPYWSKAPSGRSYRFRMAAAISGHLLRKGCKTDDVKYIISELGRLSGHADHSRVVDYTLTKLEGRDARNLATGEPTLYALMEEIKNVRT